MRGINKQTMLDLIIEAKRNDPETGSFAEWLAEHLAEHMPTLTPQNEPLTLGLVDKYGAPLYAGDTVAARYPDHCADTTEGVQNLLLYKHRPPEVSP